MPAPSGSRLCEIENRERAAIGSRRKKRAVLRPSQGGHPATISGTNQNRPALAVSRQFANRDTAIIEPSSDQAATGMGGDLRDQPTDALAEFDRRLALRS